VGFLFDVLFFYVFFAIGDLLADFVLNARNYKLFVSPVTFSVSLVVFIFVQYFFTKQNLSHQDDYFVQHEMPMLFALASLVGGAFIINFSFVLEKLNILRFLRVIGYHSLYIYVMHLMITAFTRIFFDRVLGIQNIPVIMLASVALGVVVPIIFYNISYRLGGWWLFTLSKPKSIGGQDLRKPSVGIKMSFLSPQSSVRKHKV
jgi:peptidoglycan/LPS O-acetylase OafA/YrhL